MSSANPTPSRGKRRWVQFSLRTFVVVVGLIAVWLGWLVNSATRQREAVRAILARGGTIAYDYQYDARGRRLPNGKPSRPVWLQRILDDNYFHQVVLVGLDVDEVGNGVAPTDEDLVHIERLPKLRFLYLGGGSISDDGLRHLQNLTDLHLLVLWANPISGEGLGHLRHLKKLRHLDLSQTLVTDDKLKCLEFLTGLERIDLPNNPQLSGEFLEHVAGLPNLQDLVLRGCGITDSALVHLERAKRLRALMLDGTRVTDTGVVHLRGLSNLGDLDLSGTAVSEAAVEEIEQRLPQAHVTMGKAGP
jgi:hypothetical protein